MKKQIPMALTVAGAIIAFCGCAELQLDTLEYKRLNQNELERLFQADRNVEFFSSTTRVSVNYFSDGRQECTWDSGNDKGTYRINNDEFCSTGQYRIFQKNEITPPAATPLTYSDLF